MSNSTRHKFIASTIFITLFFSFSLSAQKNQTTNQTGYWWGENVDIKKEEEKEKYLIPPPNPKTADLMKMHPQKIKQLEEDYREYAIWKKTKEAVKDYWTVVDAARRHARAFTALTGYTMLENPLLNVRAQNPITNAGRDATKRIKKKEIEKLLLENRDKFAIVMFTQKSCPYCDLQRNSLKYFTNKHYWPYKEIDINDNPAIAQRFNVQMTPITILIEKGSEQWMNIAVGAETIPNIENNTYRAVRMLQGKSKPEQFYTPKHLEGGLFDPTLPTTQ